MTEITPPSPLLVRDRMTVGVMTCAPDTPIGALARLMLEKEQEQVVVMEEGHALGVVGQEDLVKAFARQEDPATPALQIMREGVPQVPADIPLTAAVQIMLDQGTRALFLMHHAGGVEYPAAVITFRHILRCLAAEKPEDLSDLGIHAGRRLPLETFFERRDAARQAASKKSKHQE